MKKLFQIYTLSRLLYATIGIVIGLIIVPLEDYFSNLSSLKFLIPILITLIITVIFVEIKKKKFINVKLSVNVGRTETETKRYAKKGLIVFVSLYKPIKSITAKKLSIEEIKKAANSLDYYSLDLEKSNLQPAIEAIYCHKEKLKHCWLIGTTNVSKKEGSVMYQDVLIQFLKKEKGINCDFHYGQDYAIPLDDDALVCKKTYEILTRIFEEASSCGLECKDIIADYTSGIRSMVAGMILSCLHRDNDIQLIGTRYNNIADPEGELFPIYISFEPELKVHE